MYAKWYSIQYFGAATLAGATAAAVIGTLFFIIFELFHVAFFSNYENDYRNGRKKLLIQT